MASIVDIILRIKKQGEGVKDTEDSLLKLGKTLAVAAAAVTAFGIVAKKAFDLAQEGAAVAQTAESFDLLLSKVGAAPNLLNQLDEAAGGTISKMGIMSSTATLLAGAQGELATQLANSTPRLLEIARAANKLNPSLGDTTFLYNSLATGIKRASPLILDNLGLTIKVGEANAKYAASLGKAVEELTAEEQKQALLNETLRAGGVLIDQVGGNLDSATDSYTRFGAEAENATNRLKQNLHEGLEPVIEGLANFLERTNEVDDALATGFLVNAGAGLYRDAAGNLLDMGEALDLIKDNLEEIERLKNLGRLVEQLKSTSSDAVWDEIMNGVAGVGDAASSTMDALKLMNDQMILTAVAGDMSGEALRDLAVQMGFITESEAMLIERERELAGLWQSGIISAEQYALSASSLSEALDGLPESKRIEILLDIQGGEGLNQLRSVMRGGGITGGGNLPFDFARAHGGPVSGGSPYMVGEHGPEMFVPNSGGSVVSNTNVRINEDALRSEIKGLRSDLARYQETMPLMINAATEKALR